MIEYRTAEEKDLEKLIKFLSLSVIDKSFVKPLSQRDISISERVKRKYINGLWLLALQREIIAGCLALVPHKEEETVEISTYAVRPDYQGQGIGGRLIEESIKLTRERYPDYKAIILDSWEGNEGISRLMDKKGFTLDKAFYDSNKRPEGIKTLVYRRELSVSNKF